MPKLLFSLCLLIVCLYVPGQQKSDEAMRETADKLLKYLSNGDTAAIVRLYADYYFEDGEKPTEKEYEQGLAMRLEDCKTYQGYIKKFGIPKRKNYAISEGINGGRQLIVSISSKADTTFNWSYCKLVIQFYPVTIFNPEVIYGYWFDTGPLEEKLKMKPIQNPPIIKNN